MGHSRSRRRRVFFQGHKLYPASIRLHLMHSIYLYPNSAFRHLKNPASWSFCSIELFPGREQLFELADDLKIKGLLHRAVIQGIVG